jgi:hypothetical protein
MSSEATFYTVTDAKFFPGTVALVNSLRLMGHDETLVVLDNGLTQEQRERLEPHASIVDVPAGADSMAPTTLKPAPYFVRPHGTVVFIDSDIIVGAPLTPVLELAARGQICLYPDCPHQRTRWFAEWKELFGLRRTPRRQLYLNCGFVAFSAEHWPALLSDWWSACSRIPAERVFTGDNHPLRCGDQDALNAVLMTEVAPESVTVLPPEEVSNPDGTGCRVHSREALVCVRNGVRLVLMHHWDRPKAWNRSRAGFLRRLALPEPYFRVFPRVAFGPDVALRLAPEEVPWWLRAGWRHVLVTSCGIAIYPIAAAKRYVAWALRTAAWKVAWTLKGAVWRAGWAVRGTAWKVAWALWGAAWKIGTPLGRVLLRSRQSELQS